jgi:hypothetical protein
MLRHGFSASKVRVRCDFISPKPAAQKATYKNKDTFAEPCLLVRCLEEAFCRRIWRDRHSDIETTLLSCPLNSGNITTPVSVSLEVIIEMVVVAFEPPGPQLEARNKGFSVTSRFHEGEKLSTRRSSYLLIANPTWLQGHSKCLSCLPGTNVLYSHSMDFIHSQQPNYTPCAWFHEEDNMLQKFHDT